MNYDKLNKKNFEKLILAMEQSLVACPTFMFYCKNKIERPNFIRLYFKCYLHHWQKHAKIFLDTNKNFVVVLTDKNDWSLAPSGLNAIPFLSNSCSKKVMLHHNVVEGIKEFVVNPNIEAYHIQIFGELDKNLEELLALVKEAEDFAKKENKALIYETFSKKLVKIMELKGYKTLYQKFFLDSQFIETFMMNSFDN